MIDRSRGLQGNPGAVNAQKVWENQPKSGFTLRNQRHMSRESSADFHTSEQSRDNTRGPTVFRHCVTFLKKKLHSGKTLFKFSSSKGELRRSPIGQTLFKFLSWKRRTEFRTSLLFGTMRLSAERKNSHIAVTFSRSTTETDIFVSCYKLFVTCCRFKYLQLIYLFISFFFRYALWFPAKTGQVKSEFDLFHLFDFGRFLLNIFYCLRRTPFSFLTVCYKLDIESSRGPPFIIFVIEFFVLKLGSQWRSTLHPSLEFLRNRSCFYVTFSWFVFIKGSLQIL